MTLTTFEHVTLAPEVAELAARTALADGPAPLSEQFLTGLADARLGHRHILAREGGSIVGAAALEPGAGAHGEPPVAEMFVVPEARGRKVGRALFRELPEGTRVWAHGDLPAARALAESEGLTVVRHLVVMGVDGDALASAAYPAEAAPASPNAPAAGSYEALNLVQASERYGREAVEAAWLAANNEAFDWHPEQGGWDMDRLHRGMEAEWFDPHDVWFLYDGDSMAGFHWTKWHGEGVGEVYVVGLATDYRGKGVGAPLMVAGLRGLVARGAREVILYVEADNEPAVRTYRKLGFSVKEDHVVWSR